MSFVFNCTNCGQALRAPSASAGKLCKCTSCATLVRIPLVQSTPVSPAKPPPPQPLRNPLLEELDSMAEAAQARRREANLQAQVRSYEAAAAPVEKPRKRRSSRRSASSGRSVASILISIFCVLGMLCCGGVGVIGFLALPHAVVIKSSGFEAQARGGKMKERNEATGHTQGTMSALTGSEFWIGTIRMPSGVNASLDDLRSHYSSFSSSTEMVVRNSLQGIRCEGVNTSRLGVMGDVTADMELFLVDGKLVYTAYFPGSRKKAALGTGRDLGVSEVGWDKPEEFFNSIRRSQ